MGVGLNFGGRSTLGIILGALTEVAGAGDAGSLPVGSLRAGAMRRHARGAGGIVLQNRRNGAAHDVDGSLPRTAVAMIGRDTRPRIEHPAPFCPISSVPVRYIGPGTPKEIAPRVENLITFAVANSRPCQSIGALNYSWNECDEGGSMLCPKRSEIGPDESGIRRIEMTVGGSTKPRRSSSVSCASSHQTLRN
jgi:hypothetical protein